MKKLSLPFLVLLLSVSITFTAQTTNFGTDGVYTGITITTPYSVDFQTWALGLPSAQTATLYEYGGVGYTWALTQDRAAITGAATYRVLCTKPGSGTGGLTTFIYLPKLTNVKAITIDCGISATTGNYIIIQKYNGAAWVDLTPANTPFLSEAGWGTLTFDININEPIQLRIGQTSGAFYLYRKISVSAYGPAAIGNISSVGNAKIMGNQLVLGDDKDDVYFFNLSGQQTKILKNATNSIVLPNETCIIKVVKGTSTQILKYIAVNEK